MVECRNRIPSIPILPWFMLLFRIAHAHSWSVPFLHVPSPEVFSSRWYFWCLPFVVCFEFMVHEVSLLYTCKRLLDGQRLLPWFLLFHLFASLCSPLQLPKLEKHFGVSFVLICFVIDETVPYNCQDNNLAWFSALFLVLYSSPGIIR